MTRVSRNSILFLLLTGCAHSPASLPAPSRPLNTVLIPILKPCPVVHVPLSVLPSAKLSSIPNDIFDAVKAVLADNLILRADRETLSAANDSPCG